MIKDNIMLAVSIKKTLSQFLAATIFFMSLAGCDHNRHPASQPFSANKITVVDMAGRTVEIPEKVESVAIVYGVITSYIIALSKADTLAAVGYPGDFFKMVHPVFETVGTVGRGQVDMEAIAQLNPDLFIHRANDLNTLNAVQKLGIPSIGITSETREDITAMLSLLGKVFGEEDRAAELTNYFEQMLSMAREFSGDIPSAKRKSAVVMSSRLGTVATGTMLQSFMIESAGGINCAQEVQSIEVWPMVGMETIFNWNPDFIFISNFNPPRYSVESLMIDSAWANLTAIKEKNVYLVPSDKDSWEFPGISSALGSLWMLSTMYPDRLSKEQFGAYAKEFYKKVYNLDVTPELLGY